MREPFFIALLVTASCLCRAEQQYWKRACLATIDGFRWPGAGWVEPLEICAINHMPD